MCTYLVLQEFQNCNFAAEQPLTGECWISPKIDIPLPMAKEKPQQDGRRCGIKFRIKPHYPPEMLTGLKQNLVHTRTQRPH